MDYVDARLGAHDLVASLDRGWQLSRDASGDPVHAPVTPMTRIAPSLRAPRSVRVVPRTLVPTAITVVRGVAPPPSPHPARAMEADQLVAPCSCALVALAAPPFIGDSQHPLIDLAARSAPERRAPSPSGAARVEIASRLYAVDSRGHVSSSCCARAEREYPRGPPVPATDQFNSAGPTQGNLRRRKRNQ